MFKQMTLRILLVLIAYWSQSTSAASAEAPEPRAAAVIKDLRTDNPLLFSIGNLRIMGTVHSVPIAIFSPNVMDF